MEGDMIRRRKSSTKYWIFKGNQVIREETKIWYKYKIKVAEKQKSYVDDDVAEAAVGSLDRG